MSTYEQWDIVSSVGLTALVVTAGRAIEQHREDRLVNDPYAAAFVRAAAPPVALPTRPPESDDPQYLGLWEYLADRLAVRSRYFDQFFQRAVGSGLRQGVILASGLDTRAFRMSWPDDFRLFEIDQPRVLEFKNQVLESEGAIAACDRRCVRADLREDWENALGESGFDRAQPTAWLAEGLLSYLTRDAEQRLLETIHRASAPGSLVSLEFSSSSQRRQWSPVVTKYLGIDMSSLTHNDDRPSPETALAALGWTATVDTLASMADRYHRNLGQRTREISRHTQFVTAHLFGED